MADVLTFGGRSASNEQPVGFGDALGTTNAVAVRIEPGDDVRFLLPMLDRLALIEVTFPAFGDGRGYSSARVLREAGYAGELRASGDVLVDQAAFLIRCGFDSFAPNSPIDRDMLDAALARYGDVYQPAGDGRVPVWALRHGVEAADG